MISHSQRFHCCNDHTLYCVTSPSHHHHHRLQSVLLVRSAISCIGLLESVNLLPPVMDPQSGLNKTMEGEIPTNNNKFTTVSSSNTLHPPPVVVAVKTEEATTGQTQQQEQPHRDPIDDDSQYLKHKRRFCSVEGCGRIVKSQGLCQRHGAKPKTCKVEGCTKQAQGNFDKMCKAHFKAMKRRTTPIPKVEKNDVPPPAVGVSVYDAILPQSIAFNATKAATGAAMPLIAHLKHGFDTLKPPAWHRNEERRARGLFPIDNPAAQLEGWERELVWMEILVLTGVPGASFRQLARAWGRDKGFHMVLAQFICERHGDVERKKRHGENNTGSTIQRRPAMKKRKTTNRGNKATPANVGADVWDTSIYGDVDTNEALAAEIFDFTEKEFERVTSKYKVNDNGIIRMYSESEPPSPSPSVEAQAAMTAILGDHNVESLPMQPDLQPLTRTKQLPLIKVEPQEEQSQHHRQHVQPTHLQYPSTNIGIAHAPTHSEGQLASEGGAYNILHPATAHTPSSAPISHTDDNHPILVVQQRHTSIPVSIPGIAQQGDLSQTDHASDHQIHTEYQLAHEQQRRQQQYQQIDGARQQTSMSEVQQFQQQNDHPFYQQQQERSDAKQQHHTKEVNEYRPPIAHADYDRHPAAQYHDSVRQGEHQQQFHQHNVAMQHQVRPQELPIDVVVYRSAEQYLHQPAQGDYQQHNDGSQQQNLILHVHRHGGPDQQHQPQQEQSGQFQQQLTVETSYDGDHQQTEQHGSRPRGDYQHRQVTDDTSGEPGHMMDQINGDDEHVDALDEHTLSHAQTDP